MKRLTAAKTRLRGALGPHLAHDRLVLALARDTVRAAVRCPRVARVWVVTDDPLAADRLAAIGAEVVSDGPDGGLNPALRHAAAQISLAWPDAPVATLTADLPALRPAELAAALVEAARRGGRGFVADAAGTGTTLLAACPGHPLDPRYGPGSATRHAESGAHRLTGTWPSLRRDVDTAADLAAAARLGLGPHTATVQGVQATVAEYDPQRRCGAVLLDSGRRCEFGADAFDRSGLRLLRGGQRVQVFTDESGTITRVTLPTMRGHEHPPGARVER